MSLITGADATPDEVFNYIKCNLFKNHYRAAAPPADAVAGMIWVDSDDNQAYVYTGAVWVPLIDVTGVSKLTGTMQWDKGADIASQAALAPGADGNYFDVTGVAAITSIAAVQSQPGTVICLHFDGILVLTHHATDLILPGGANITTAAGDEAIFIEYAAGDWRCICYTKATGLGLSNVKVGYFTRDLALASGDVAYTGVGFVPKAIIFIATDQTGGGPTPTFKCYGFSDGINDGVNAFLGNSHVIGYDAGNCILAYPEAGHYHLATIASFDADGFTLTWTKTGSPTGTYYVIYLAMR